jgi:hypothetical protein
MQFQAGTAPQVFSYGQVEVGESPAPGTLSMPLQIKKTNERELKTN